MSEPTADRLCRQSMVCALWHCTIAIVELAAGARIKTRGTQMLIVVILPSCTATRSRYSVRPSRCGAMVDWSRRVLSLWSVEEVTSLTACLIHSCLLEYMQDAKSLAEHDHLEYEQRPSEASILSYQHGADLCFRMSPTGRLYHLT